MNQAPVEIYTQILDAGSAGAGIDKFNTSGVYQSTVSGSVTIDASGGLAVDSSGGIYAGSLNNGTAAEYTATGAFVKYLYNQTIAGTGYLGEVQAIALDGNGSLYVGDFNVIHKIDIATATQTWRKGGNFSGNSCIPVVNMNDIYALGSDSSGNVYELDQDAAIGYSNFIYKLDANGNLLCAYQVPTTGSLSSAQFFGMAVQPGGIVDAADANDHQLVEFMACGSSPPSCSTYTPTATPSGTNTGNLSMAMVRKGFAAEEMMPAFTPTPSPTASPTPTVGEDSLIQSAVAAPNISGGQQPIHLLVGLGKPAKITLSLFTLAGEKVFETQAEGNTGSNTLTWDVQNQADWSVASGLYVYILWADDGIVKETRTGKIAVIR